VRKKIWVGAIDLDHWNKTDPSHPAFFLPGQPLNDTDAKRPFVALEPCAPLGASVSSKSWHNPLDHSGISLKTRQACSLQEPQSDSWIGF
jgi:hypothetical protein